MKIANILFGFFVIVSLFSFIDYNSVNYDVGRVPELTYAFNHDGSYIDLRNSRATYGDNFLPSVKNSMQFEYVKYRYF